MANDIKGKQAKDEKWVDFYYFWKLQYFLRAHKLRVKEEKCRILKEVLEITKDTKPIPSERYHEIYKELNKDKEEKCILFHDQDIERFDKYDIFCWIDGYCTNVSCPVRQKISTYCNILEDIDEYVNKSVLNDIDLEWWEENEASSEEIITNLLLGYGLDYFLEEGKVTREQKNFGIQVIGTQDISIGKDGKLLGSLIVTIDLSTPLSFLQHEIKALKSYEFKHIPSFKEIEILTTHDSINYSLEKELISSSENIAFSTKDVNARAVGLWLYDVIDEEKRFSSVIEAYNAMRDGIWYKDEIGDCEDSDMKKIQFPLSDLGYAVSDPSVFRRLYRNTKRCITNCEVLSLKD